MAGATHSGSPLYPDEGDILLDMRNYTSLEDGKAAERDYVCIKSIIV